MTPEEIRKQMMSSAGTEGQHDAVVDEELAASNAAHAIVLQGSIVTQDSNSERAPPESIRKAVWDDDFRGEWLWLLKDGDQVGMNVTTSDSSKGFRVEYGEGHSNERFTSDPNPVTREELEKLLFKYAAGDQSFKTDLQWRRIIPKKSKPNGPKSMLLAIVLAALFGPLGLFYVSWKRALAMLLFFILGVSLIPKNGFVVLLLWLVAPILSIILLGVGKRQPPPA